MARLRLASAALRRSTLVTLIKAEWRTLLLVLVTVSLLSRAGFLAPLERMAGALFVLSRDTMDVVRVVTVTDDEFHRSDRGFDGKRPLDPDLLRCALMAAAAGHPRVIAVDIETTLATEAFEKLTSHNSRCPDIPLDPAAKKVLQRVIWAVGARRSVSETPSAGASTFRRLRDAWAGADTGMYSIASHAATGELALANFMTDSDGAVRRYRDSLPVGETREPAVTLPVALAARYCQLSPNRDNRAEARCARILAEREHPTGKPRLLDYSLASQQLSQTTMSDAIEAAATEAWGGSAGFIYDRAVLIGGVFEDARDNYYTPLGLMSGASLNVHATLSHLRSGGVPDAPGLDFSLEVLFGLALAYGNHRLRWKHRWLVLVVTTMLAFVVLFVGVYFAFRFRLVWISLPALAVGIWLHQRHSQPHHP